MVREADTDAQMVPTFKGMTGRHLPCKALTASNGLASGARS